MNKTIHLLQIWPGRLIPKFKVAYGPQKYVYFSHYFFDNLRSPWVFCGTTHAADPSFLSPRNEIRPIPDRHTNQAQAWYPRPRVLVHEDRGQQLCVHNYAWTWTVIKHLSSRGQLKRFQCVLADTYIVHKFAFLSSHVVRKGT